MSALVDELRATDALTKPLVYTISVGSDGGFIEAVSLADYEAAVDTLQSRLEAVTKERDAWKGRSDEAQGWSLSHLERAEAAEARVEELQKALEVKSTEAIKTQERMRKLLQENTKKLTAREIIQIINQGEYDRLPNAQIITKIERKYNL
jgi:hypothetical protein